MASSVAPQEIAAGSIHIEDPPIDYVEQTNLVYHQLCAAQTFEQGEGKPFHVNGTHLAVFRYGSKFYAVDNRLSAHGLSNVGRQYQRRRANLSLAPLGI